MNAQHISHTSHTSEAVKDGKAEILSGRKGKEGEGKAGAGRGGGRSIHAVELLLCSTPEDRPHIFILSVKIGTLCLEVIAPSIYRAWPLPEYHLSPVSCYSSWRLAGMGEWEPGSAGNRVPLAKAIFADTLRARDRTGPEGSRGLMLWPPCSFLQQKHSEL